jgi:hypothetical protein
VLASIAAARTDTLRAAGELLPSALTGGYHLAFIVGAIFAAAAALLGGLRLRETHPASVGHGEETIGAPAAECAN